MTESFDESGDCDALQFELAADDGAPPWEPVEESTTTSVVGVYSSWAPVDSDRSLMVSPQGHSHQCSTASTASISSIQDVSISSSGKPSPANPGGQPYP